MKMLFLLFLLAFYNVNYGQKLKVKIYNKTGYDLDSVFFQKIYVGHFNKDSTITFSSFKELSLTYSAPSFNVNAVIHGKTKNYSTEVIYGPGLESGPMGVCGNGSSRTVYYDLHEFDIIYKDTKEGYWLYWVRHK